MSVQSKIAPEGAKTTNPKVLAFVEEAKALFKPEQVVWCDGSKEEYQHLLSRWSMAARRCGSTPRSARTRSWCAPTPSDVARVEDQTYIARR